MRDEAREVPNVHTASNSGLHVACVMSQGRAVKLSHSNASEHSLLSSTDMNIKMLSPSCDESKRMVDWVEKGE